MCQAVILNRWKFSPGSMEENKNNQPIEDERKQSIRYTMGCLLVIFLGISSIVVGLIIMYLKSIMNGSKEFFIK
jgi:hypothetical protein